MVKIARPPFELLASLSRVPHTTPARLGQHLGFAHQLVVPVKLAAATFPFHSSRHLLALTNRRHGRRLLQQ